MQILAAVTTKGAPPVERELCARPYAALFLFPTRIPRGGCGHPLYRWASGVSETEEMTQPQSHSWADSEPRTWGAPCLLQGTLPNDVLLCNSLEVFTRSRW